MDATQNLRWKAEKRNKWLVMTGGYTFSALCIFLFISFCPLLCIYSFIPTKHGFLFTAFSFQESGDTLFCRRGSLSPAQPNISLPFWQQWVSDSCTLNLVRKSGQHFFAVRLSAPLSHRTEDDWSASRTTCMCDTTWEFICTWNGKVNWGGNSVEAVSWRQMKQIALVEKCAVKHQDTWSSWIYVCTWITFPSCFHQVCWMLWCT